MISKDVFKFWKKFRNIYISNKWKQIFPQAVDEFKDEKVVNDKDTEVSVVLNYSKSEHGNKSDYEDKLPLPYLLPQKSSKNR